MRSWPVSHFRQNLIRSLKGGCEQWARWFSRTGPSGWNPAGKYMEMMTLIKQSAAVIGSSLVKSLFIQKDINTPELVSSGNPELISVICRSNQWRFNGSICSRDSSKVLQIRDVYLWYHAQSIFFFQALKSLRKGLDVWYLGGEHRVSCSCFYAAE